MDQGPPILLPFEEKEAYEDISTEKTLFNGITNGSNSPQMPILYQADRDLPPFLNIQDIFSNFADDHFSNSNCCDYTKSELRTESDSLFERLHKDFSATLTAPLKLIAKDTESNLIKEPKKIVEERSEVVKNKINEKLGANDESTEKTVKTVAKDVKRKSRKRKPKKYFENFSEEEDPRKYGIKTTKIRVKGRSLKSSLPPVESSASLKDLTENKYLKTPFITQRNRSPKKHTQNVSVISESYEIVNPAARAATDYQSFVFRPNIKTLTNNQFSAIHSSVCAFCGLKSDFIDLGTLYGPYFIEKESVKTLPLTNIFPTDVNRDSQIGVSGKTAIKSDANGSLKMVIQSAKGVRNSRKCFTNDYRITWDGEVWFHRECVLWAPGTYLRGDGQIGGLAESLKMALNAECCVCHKLGAILNCTTKNCDLDFHYFCAITHGSKLNEEQFSLLCSKHKDR